MPRVEGAALALAAVPTAHEPEQLSLFGGGIDLMALRRERASIAESRLSPATREAYRWDWADFTRWCDCAGRVLLPASSDTVQLYAVYLAGLQRSPNTIERRCAAIAQRHLAAGFKSPVDEDVREVLAGIRRRLGACARHAKAALSVPELRKLLAAAGQGRGAAPARDRAVLLLGFASGCRRLELANLDLADVELLEAGVILHLRRSKTDQEGRGREVAVHRGECAATCPVEALEAWLRLRGPAAGPLFCRLHSRSGAVVPPGLRMSGEAVARIVQECAGRAGLDRCRYGGHSLRAGLATAAAESGASELAIMRRTGHRSVDMVQRYVRHGTLFAVNPLAGLL